MRCIPGLLACTAGALTALSAYAQVDDNGGTPTLGGSFGPGCGHLVNPERECPHIASSQQGNMFYDAAVTKKFEVNVRPATISLCIPNTTVPGQPFPICDPVTMIPGTTGRELTIRVRVDNDGTLIGSYDATQPDLVVTGSFHDAFGCTPPDFTGVLLTGRVLAFGYDDCVGPCTPFPGRCTANFDFVFQITGGVLAPLFAGKNLAVTFTSENNSFNGNDFNLDGQPDRFTSAFNSKFGNKVDIWASTSLLQSACCNTTTGACTLVNFGQTCPNGTTSIPGNSCTPNTCPQPSVCCDTTTGACTIALPSTQCAVGSIVLPGATTCTPANPCPQPRVCCDTTTGLCTIALPGTQCAAGSVAFPNATACVPNPCPQPSVCCDVTTGACTIAAPGVQCVPGTRPLPAATSCLPTNPCPPPHVCCDNVGGFCLIVPPGVPCPAGMSELPGISACVPNNCPQPSACCDTTTGVCFVVPPNATCPTGAIPAPSASCNPNLCPQPKVCCDASTGFCIVVPASASCPAGSFQTPATSCVTAACPQPKVCCDVATGQCLIIPANSQCPAGSTQSTATSCVTANCAQPKVCCDNTTGACTIVPANANCPAGTTQSTATICTPTTCPQPSVCCDVTTGVCTIALPGTQCATGSRPIPGVFTCTPNNPCPQPTVCCDTTTGACVLALPGVQCAAGSQPLPGATTCSPSNPCQQPKVCCDATTGACTIVPPGAVCPTGTNQNSATSCTPTNPCPQPQVCCDSTTGACTIALPGTLCAPGSTTPTGVTACSPTNPCPQQHVCCDTTTGACTMIPPAATCPSGTTLSTATSCSPNTCPQPKICCDTTTGVCTVALPDTSCAAGSTELTGATACNPNPCQQPNVCCDTTTGACTIALPGAQCAAGSTSLPGATACTPTNPCRQPSVCCDTTTGACTIVLPGASCPSGTTVSTATSCTPSNPCPQPSVCCNTSDGTCTIALPSVQCAAGSTSLPGATSCSPTNPCPQQHVCCDDTTGACTVIAPGASCPSGTTQATGSVCAPNSCPQPSACCNPTTGLCSVVPPGAQCPAGSFPVVPASSACTAASCETLIACCNLTTGQCTTIPGTGTGTPMQVSVKLTSNALGLGTSTISSPVEYPGRFFTSSMTGTGTILNVQRSGIAGPGTTSDPLLVTVTAQTHLDITNYPSGFPMPHDFQAGFVSLTAESSNLPDGANEGMGVKAFTVGTSGAGLGLRVLSSSGVPQVEGSFDVSGGTDGPDYHGNGAPHVDESGNFNFAANANVPASSVVVSLAHFDSSDVVDVTINLTNGNTYTFPNLRTTSTGMSSPAPGADLWYITFANLRAWAPTDIVSSFVIRANDPNPASPRGTAEHFLISGFLATSGSNPSCPPGSVPASPATGACVPNPCPQPTACCDTTTMMCLVVAPGASCPAGSVPASPASTACTPAACAMPVACCDLTTHACTIVPPLGSCASGSVPASPSASTCTPVTTCCPAPSVEVMTTVVPTPCPCDRDGNGILDSNDINSFLAAYAAGNADFNGDGATNISDFYAFFDCIYASNPQVCSTTPIGVNACPGGTRITSLTLEYTGQGCTATSTSQGSGKFHCSGDPANAAQVYVRVTDQSNPTSTSGHNWFTGVVPLGGSYIAAAANGGASQLPATTYVHVFDASHTTLLQSVDFKSDCSQPLLTGDRFGSVRVLGFATNPPTNTSPDTQPVCQRYRIDFNSMVSCDQLQSIVGTIETACLQATTVQNGDIIEVCCPPPGNVTDLCGTSGGRPTSLTFRYTGADCASSHNSMAAGKVTCSGSLSTTTSPASVYMVATDSSTAGSGHVYFASTVPLNGTFTVNSSAGGLSTFTTNTYFYVYSAQGGTLLQAIGVHTSCSQPLIPGESYAALTLLSITTSTGATATLPTTCSSDVVNGILTLLADHATITVTATTVSGATTSTQVNVSACTPPPMMQQSVCPNGTHPKTLTLKYTGQDCSATHDTQAAGKVSCTGDPAMAPSVMIRVTDSSSPTDTTGHIYFEGPVALNANFTADSTAAGLSRFGTDTYVHIFSPTGTLLQSIKFHTSCSQPLLTGDQFGSILLVGFSS